MDVNSKKKDIFFTNLLILGFDKAAVEKKHRVKCDRYMFVLPNMKMLEVILHFLFSKLSEVGPQKYPLVWPLLDKDHQRQFLKTCYTYLSNIALVSSIGFPRMVPSLLSSYGGDKLYDVLFALSTHVVHASIPDDDVLQRPPVANDNSKEVSVLATLVSIERFRDLNKMSRQHMEWLTKGANKLIVLIQKLKSDITSLETLCKSKRKILAVLYPEEIDLEAIDFHEKLGKLTADKKTEASEMWFRVGHLCHEVSASWQVILRTEHSKFLDAASFSSLNPDDLPKEHGNLLKEIGSLTPEGNNNVCLVRFLKKFLVFLDYFSKSLQKGDFSEIQSVCSTECLENLHSELQALQTINTKLSTDVVPKTYGNVQEMQDRMFSEQLLKDLTDASLLDPTLLRIWGEDSVSALLGDATCEASSLFNEYLDKHLKNVKYSPESIQGSLDSTFFMSSESNGIIDSMTDFTVESSFNKLQDKNDFGTSIQQNQDEELSALQNSSQLLLDVSTFDLSLSPSMALRPSFLLEESLNAMSLSDCSFLDM